MLTYFPSVIIRLWEVFIGCLDQLARVVVFAVNITMFPRKRTHRPHWMAVVVWTALNSGAFVWIVNAPDPRLQLYAAAVLAVVHFVFIVTALLVITEENDVWAGYVRFDRETGKDDRIFKRGSVVKSLPLMLLSGVLYVACCAVVLKAWHANHIVLKTSYSGNIPLLHYLVTVAAQAPMIETALKWIGLNRFTMEFEGIKGLAIKSAIELSYASIVVAAITSYFRQKGDVRRLVQALGGKTGDMPVLVAQAARAPEEIKSAILSMALHDSAAGVRKRAMTVAVHANILTFPSTIIYSLHRERSEKNKIWAIAAANSIITNPHNKLNAEYFDALRSKIDYQLNVRATRHRAETLDELKRLRDALPSSRVVKIAA
jgi:hypothetical protein